MSTLVAAKPSRARHQELHAVAVGELHRRNGTIHEKRSIQNIAKKVKDKEYRFWLPSAAKEKHLGSCCRSNYKYQLLNSSRRYMQHLRVHTHTHTHTHKHKHTHLYIHYPFKNVNLSLQYVYSLCICTRNKKYFTIRVGTCLIKSFF